MKNKKILGTIIGILSLSLPTTLKINAMEKNQKNFEENTKTTEKNFNFSDDEYFDAIFEDHFSMPFLKTI